MDESMKPRLICSNRIYFYTVTGNKAFNITGYINLFCRHQRISLELAYAGQIKVIEPDSNIWKMPEPGYIHVCEINMGSQVFADRRFNDTCNFPLKSRVQL